MDEEQGIRDPEDARDEIREKVDRGEEPTSEEREFLEGEKVDLDTDRSGYTPSELTG